MTRPRALMCAVLVSGFCLASACQAGVNRTWTGAAGNASWLDANNWTPVGSPYLSDNLTVADGGAHIDFDLEVADGGSITISGFGTSVSAAAGTGSVKVGDWLGSGTMTIEQSASFYMDPQIAGIYIPTSFHVGWGGSGTLNVRDADSQLHSYAGSLTVGMSGGGAGAASGHGTVNVYGGGKITMDTIDVGIGGLNWLGQIFVTGAGSKVASTRHMVLGTDGTAVVVVGSGASIETGALTLGQDAGGYGTLTLRGNGAFADMAIGAAGYGEVQVLDGGVADLQGATDVELGMTEMGKGRVLVQGAGSLLDVRSGVLRVGVLGSGEVELLDGGSAIAAEVVVAPTLLGRGPSTVKVSGANSDLIYDESIRFHSGTLEISGGGQLRSTFAGSGPGGQDCLGGPGNARKASAVVTGAQSKWDGGTKASLTVSAGLNPAELAILQGGQVFYGSLRIGEEGFSDGLVRVEGAGSLLHVNGLGADENVAGGAGTVVGYQGTGQLVIGDHGHVASNWGGAQIAPVAGAKGTVTVQGSATWGIGGDLHVGGWQGGNGGQGTLALDSKAKVSVSGNLAVWQQGVLILKGGTTMTIGGDTLTWANQAQYRADPGATIVFYGTNVQIESTHSADVAGLADTTLVFAGGPRVMDRIEVAGAERGPEWNGFQNNFAVGRIVVGTPSEPSHLELADLVDNGSGGVETLYVRELVLHPGSTVNLGNHNLRVLELTDLGGSIVAGGEGRLDPLGAIRSIDIAETYLTFEPGEENTGALQVREYPSVRLASDLQERFLPEVYVDLSASWVRDEEDLAARLARFVDGRAALMGEGGESALLDARFEELVLMEDGEGGLIGHATLDVDYAAWANAFAMDYRGQIELQVAIAHTGSLQEFLSGFDGQAVMGMTPVPEPATLSLLALGGLAALLRRKRG